MALSAANSLFFSFAHVFASTIPVTGSFDCFWNALTAAPVRALNDALCVPSS